MKRSWQVLKEAIPRGDAETVAHRLNLSADTIRRWRREPLSDDAPLSTGNRSILDRVCDLIDAVVLTNPEGAHLIPQFVADYYRRVAGEQWQLKEAPDPLTVKRLCDQLTDALVANGIDRDAEFRSAALKLRTKLDSLLRPSPLEVARDLKQNVG